MAFDNNQQNQTDKSGFDQRREFNQQISKEITIALEACRISDGDLWLASLRNQRNLIMPWLQEEDSKRISEKISMLSKKFEEISDTRLMFNKKQQQRSITFEMEQDFDDTQSDLLSMFKKHGFLVPEADKTDDEIFGG